MLQQVKERRVKKKKKGADYLITTRGPGSIGRASLFEHAGIEICCMVVSQVLPNPFGIFRKQPRVVGFAMSPYRISCRVIFFFTGALLKWFTSSLSNIAQATPFFSGASPQDGMVVTGRFAAPSACCICASLCAWKTLFILLRLTLQTHLLF